MPSLLRSIPFFCLALILPALAQELASVQLNGRVLDASGAGVAGVTITLQGSALSSTTDNEGKWSLIQAGEPSVLASAAPAGFRAEYRHGMLQLQIPRAGKVRLEVMDFLGKSLRVWREEYGLPGQYAVQLPPTIPDGVWLVRIQGPGGSQTLRWVQHEGNSHAETLRPTVSAPHSLLAREGGIPDSLILQYKGAELGRMEQGNLMAGTLPDMILCKVTPSIYPASAASIEEALPLYALVGFPFSFHLDFDPSKWRPTRLSVGGNSRTTYESFLTAALGTAKDSVKITMSTPLQSLSLSNLKSLSLDSGVLVLGASASSGLPLSITSNTPSLCSAHQDSILLLGAGTCSLTLAQGGDDFFYSIQKDTSFIIKQGSQVLSFGGIASASYGQAPILLSASTSAGLPVTFTSSTPRVCRIADNVMYLDSAGSCSYTLSQAGNEDYRPVSQVLSLSVAKASQVIAVEPVAPKTYQNPAFLVYASTTSNLPLSYSSQSPTICSFSGSTASILSAGTCEFTVSQGGNAYYASASLAHSFSIAKASQQITISPIDLKTYSPTPFSVTLQSSSGLVANLSSQTPEVCSASGSSITTLKAGICTVVAQQGGNEKFLSAQSEPSSFTVLKASQSITITAVSAKTFGVAPFAISASVNSGLPLSYNTQTPEVCTTSGATVSVVGAGNCIIAVDQPGDERYSSATSPLEFLVNKATQTITFTAPTSRAYLSADTLLVPTSNSGIAVVLSSSTPAVCTISDNILSIASVGTCTLEANANASTNYLAASPVSRSISITKANPALSISTIGSLVYAPGATLTLEASSPSNGALSYVSNSTGICTVSGTVVTLLNAGACLLSATQSATTLFNAASDTMIASIAKADQIINVQAPINSQTYSNTPFSLKGLATASSGLAVSYSSATPSVCTVSTIASPSADTLVTMLTGDADCQIRISQTGSSRYNAAPDVISSIYIDKATQTITFPPISGPRALSSGSFAISAATTSAPSLVVTLSSMTPSICEINGLTVTPLAIGTCTIKADQIGNDKYDAAASVLQSVAIE